MPLFLGWSPRSSLPWGDALKLTATEAQQSRT
jgi:hypothetical protein